MSLRKWMLALIRDDAKHAELDLREQKAEAVVADLQAEVRSNGFGRIFDLATHPVPKGKHP